MTKSSIAIVAASFVLFAPGLRAQTMTGATPPPPEVDVLASAVSAISRMHMDAFSDSTLWEAAIDGLIGALNDPTPSSSPL